jgi:hypothetical protein
LGVGGGACACKKIEERTIRQSGDAFFENMAGFPDSQLFEFVSREKQAACKP